MNANNYFEKEFVIEKQISGVKIIDCTKRTYYGDGYDNFTLKVSSDLEGQIVDFFRNDLAYRIRVSDEDFSMQHIEFPDPQYNAKNIDRGLVLIKDDHYEFDAQIITHRKFYQLEWNEETNRIVRQNNISQTHYNALREVIGSSKGAIFYVELFVREISEDTVERMIKKCKSSKNWSTMIIVLGDWATRYLPEQHNLKRKDKFDYYFEPIHDGCKAYLEYLVECKELKEHQKEEASA